MFGFGKYHERFDEILYIIDGQMEEMKNEINELKKSMQFLQDKRYFLEEKLDENLDRFNKMILELKGIVCKETAKAKTRAKTGKK